MRILVLGFSVTADPNGFASLLSPLLPGHEVVVVGIGGIELDPLPALFEDVTCQRGRFDVVLLEVFTSMWGRGAPLLAPAMVDTFHDLANRVQDTGAKLAMVSLYRSDVDYDRDTSDLLAYAIAARFDVPRLDLAGGLIRARGRAFCETLVRDGVHQTADGARFVAEQVAAFVSAVMHAVPLTLPRARNRIVAVKPEAQMRMDRSGYVFTYAELQEDQSLTLEFPPSQLCGIAFVSGPTAGQIEVTAGDRRHVVQCFDRHSYYSRYASKRLPLVPCSSVTVRQLPGVPNVELIKGSKDTGPRVGRVISVFVQEPADRG